MPIPKYNEIMLPFLKQVGNKKTHKIRDIVPILADYYKLTDEERAELIASGTTKLFNARVNWAKTYLKKAGLVEQEKRGYVNITQRGIDILEKNPTQLELRDLAKFKNFRDFHPKPIPNADSTTSRTTTIEPQSEFSPEEQLGHAHQALHEELARELLAMIMDCSPAFFESLVVDLLLKMGYGGSRKDAGKTLGKTGDGGIDGIIYEDRLGLDTIYLQAKRWSGSVSIKEVRDFAGALLGQNTKRGVFITTSYFPKSAYVYIDKVEHKIILIDGKKLTDLMIEYNVGTTLHSVYEVRKIDTDYFSEE